MADGRGTRQRSGRRAPLGAGTQGRGPHERPPAWHATEASEVLRRLAASPGGLAASEAERRLETHGPNELPKEPPPAVWRILLRQFKSPLIYVLLLAALVALAIGDLADAGFIGVVLVVNALIGGYQEWKAERSSRALQQLLQIRTSVLRDGDAVEVPAEELVPGDVVFVEAGSRIPADIRLLTAYGLEVDESLLTGESVPVTKETVWLGEPDAPLAERRNMVFGGSTAARGRGEGVVVATGAATAIGQLAIDVMTAHGGRTPLMDRMARFSQAVAGIVLVSAVIVGVLGGVVHAYAPIQMVLFGIALAVAAIPEGLPITITVALAIATRRMARRGVIVRRLAAVEGLGSCTYIISDKTGTLTVNELTVRRLRLADGTLLEVEGMGFVPEGRVVASGRPVRADADPEIERIARIAVLCNEATLHQRNGQWTWHGDPTDVALLSVARKLGVVREAELARNPQVNEIPFDPEHRFAASYNRIGGDVEVLVKGAPERVVPMCGGDRREHEALLRHAREMAERGYRVLALASGSAPPDFDTQRTPSEPSELRFAGLVGMIDPLRSGVREAVTACRKAGITVTMATGDHPVTALAIARELGLADRPDQVVTGTEVEEIAPEELSDMLETVRVFARAAPRQKLDIVQAGRRRGHYVAVTGDGVNDAPALRAAHIGVAMGRGGTDVAREAAELVISDDNFATIVSGIEEGRVAYDNIRKVIFLLVSTGAAEVLLLGVAVAAGAPLPLLPVQILWLNLVTSGIQDKPLAFEAPEGDVLARPPRRPGEPIFDSLMIERTVVVAATMAMMGYALFTWLLSRGWPEDVARSTLLLFIVLMKTFHLAGSRSETTPALAMTPWSNPWVLAAAVVAVAVHWLAIYVPVTRDVLELYPVSVEMFLTLTLAAGIVLVVMELHKWSLRTRRRRPPRVRPAIRPELMQPPGRAAQRGA